MRAAQDDGVCCAQVYFLKLDFPPGAPWPSTWCRDLGGQKSHKGCMQLVVSVVDQHGHLVTPDVLLNLGITLLYDDMEELKPEKQHVLKEINLADSRLYIDKHGSGKLNLRIEEVSSKHCGRPFVVRVHAVNAPEIHHAETSAVTVASKNTKKATRPRRDSAGETAVQTPPLQASFCSVEPLPPLSQLYQGSAEVDLTLAPDQLAQINAIICSRLQAYLSQTQPCVARDGNSDEAVYMLRPQVNAQVWHGTNSSAMSHSL